MDLAPFFNQYLRDTRIPILEYKFKNNSLSYRWTNNVAGFTIPIKVTLNGKEKWLQPISEWKEAKLKSKDLKLQVNSDFYVNVLKIEK
jgi:hypothetical protein